MSCGVALGRSNRAKEHVIADWLLSELGSNAEPLLQFLADDSEPATLQTAAQRVHALDSLLQGEFCAGCNTGWMARAEGEAKVIASGLMARQIAVSALNPQQCLQLARWATKTAVVLSHAAPLKRFLPARLLPALRTHETQLPEGVGVFGAQQSYTHDFVYFQKNTWQNFTAAAPGPEQQFSEHEMLEEAHKVALQLRHLLLLVAVPPPSFRGRFVLAAGLHVPIWPLDPPIFPAYRVSTQLPTQLDPHDLSRDLVRVFSDTLAVFHLPAAASP